MAKETKTVISFTKKTPEWAKWMFRVVFFITSFLTVWVYGTELISKSWKLEIMLILKSLDFSIYFISKGFGVSTKKPDTDKPN